ncbi:MAG TPA: peptidoglycan-binding domain-containing protein [Stellaceae bacterium]|jgi:peptidoglycan hydrolase-like protein with peptidoglycan-binding domain
MRLQPWTIAAAVVVALSRAASAVAPSIAELQSELRAAGYDPGPINGVMTVKTERAMRAYRRAHGQAIAASDPIRTAQAALAAMGLLPVPPDGVVGPQTRDAIIRFQAASHLPIDPRISDALLTALERAAQPTATAAPSGPSGPPPAAPEAEGRQPLPPGVTPPPIR